MTTEAPVAATAALDPDDVRKAMETDTGDTPGHTDGAPPTGSLTIAGRPARPFAYFDYNLMQDLDNAGVANQDIVLCVAFAMTHVTDDEIAKVYRLSREPEELVEAMMIWSATAVPISGLATLADQVSSQIEEYVEVSGPVGTPDGQEAGGLEAGAEGNAKPSPQESPNSDVPFSDSPV